MRVYILTTIPKHDLSASCALADIDITMDYEWRAGFLELQLLTSIVVGVRILQLL